MTVPFLYKIHDKKTNMSYGGCRYKSGCHPDDLGKTYFSSSNLLKKEIQDRPEDFEYEIIDVYETGEEARMAEERFLTFYDCASSDQWYNKHNGGKNFCNDAPDIRKRMSESAKMRKGRISPMKGKNHSDDTKRKIAKTLKESTSMVSTETRRKISESKKGKLRPDVGDRNKTLFSGKKHSEDHKKNISETQKERYKNKEEAERISKRQLENAPLWKVEFEDGRIEVKPAREFYPIPRQSIVNKKGFKKWRILSVTKL